jgi:hypothetical protein
VHDHFLPYRGMDRVDHAFCNAHILRELQALIEIDGETWAAVMRDMLLDANAAVNKAREAGETAPAQNRRGLRRALLGGGSARPLLPSSTAQTPATSQRTRPPQTTRRPKSARKAEDVQNRNAAVPHRLRRPLHQQSGRARPEDDEGENENLRLIPNPRRRPNLRKPPIRRLDRPKTRLQYPADPHRRSKSNHPRLDRVDPGLGVTLWRYSCPLFLKSLTNSVFLVSTDMAC